MMTARTAGSRFHSLSTAVISARIGVSQALSFHGLFSVIVPMPSVLSVRMTAVLMRCSLGLKPHIERRGPALSNGPLNGAACSASMPECSEDNHDWQVSACGCAGHAHGAHSGQIGRASCRERV